MCTDRVLAEPSLNLIADELPSARTDTWTHRRKVYIYMTLRKKNDRIHTNVHRTIRRLQGLYTVILRHLVSATYLHTHSESSSGAVGVVAMPVAVVSSQSSLSPSRECASFLIGRIKSALFPAISSGTQ